MALKKAIYYFHTTRLMNLKAYSDLDYNDLLKSSMRPGLKASMIPMDLAWFDAAHDDPSFGQNQ